ncbi:IS5 family transposase [Salinarimonas sp. NSM]|uniref:IS5 family transposase n=1 Tax=Salinarimonas sp. NSM TaxID=3458003 RepID=UPI00403595A9
MAPSQMSFADHFTGPRLGSNKPLEAIDALIDWAPLEARARELRKGQTGRPPFAALAMLKALYLQSLYALSDPQLEAALLDRLSFRRFCGFGLDERTPDETTILRFRHDAARAGLLEACFEAINTQLEAKGLIVKKGTLIDATLTEAAHRKPSFEKGGAQARSPHSPDATFTRKNNKSYFGYKQSIGVDEKSLLVRRIVVTPNCVSDSEAADALICGDERAVYGDRGYTQKARRERLAAAGIKPRIMHRRTSNGQELPRWKERHNELISRRRAPVESVFSVVKRLYGQARARCHRLGTVSADAVAAVTVYNLKRALRLIERREQRREAPASA